MNEKNEWENFIFDFEKLEVYQLSLEFVHKVINTVRKLPSDLRFSIGANFIRAAISIANNIAEGSGKKSSKEKRRYYSVALDSARESIPTITVLHRQEQITTENKQILRADCVKMCNKLGKLIDSVR